jgi:GNAT superfamily N-acetyltransferase
MKTDDREIIALTLDERPERTGEVRQLNDKSWPKFLYHDDIRNWNAILDENAAFQLALLENETLVAAGLTAPFDWHRGEPLPETIDEIMHVATWPLARPGGVLCALAALVTPEHRRRGISRRILREMIALAGRHDLAGVVVPVRPTRKAEFPREPIERYADRRLEDGRLFDPWLRVHEELGAERLGYMLRALTVRGSRAEWEEWTGVPMDSGDSIEVPHALVPVEVDHSADTCVYLEPNVWYFHPAPT